MESIVAAALLYRPHGFGSQHHVIIGSTDDPKALRVVRDCLWQDVTGEVEIWRNLDPGIAAMKIGEVDRLARVLSIIFPTEEELEGVLKRDPKRPHLHVVRDPSFEPD